MATARLQAVEEAVRVLVQVLHPPDDAPRQHLLLHGVYEALLDLDVPADVVSFRHGTFERQRHSLMTLPYLALKEGRLLYDGGPQAA
jgi:hypothetical protein